GPLRDRPLGQVAGHGGAADADADRLHLADAAVADELAGPAEAAAELAPLLAAGLEDDLVLADRVHDLPPLGDGHGQRLLAIDVLAGPGRQDAGDGVPVVRRGDDDGVDVRAGEQVAEVIVGRTA